MKTDTNHNYSRDKLDAFLDGNEFRNLTIALPKNYSELCTTVKLAFLSGMSAGNAMAYEQLRRELGLGMPHPPKPGLLCRFKRLFR